LTSLETRNCPLCRKPFSLDRIKKLHVDLPDANDLAPGPAVEILQRIALVSRETASDEDVRQAVDEAKAFLDTHLDNAESVSSLPPLPASLDRRVTERVQYLPLVAAIEALSRFDAMKDAFENQKREFTHKERSWKHQFRNAHTDLKTARAVERSLLKQVEEIEASWRTCALPVSPN
jgi:hypothetical protein